MFRRPKIQNGLAAIFNVQINLGGMSFLFDRVMIGRGFRNGRGGKERQMRDACFDEITRPLSFDLSTPSVEQLFYLFYVLLS